MTVIFSEIVYQIDMIITIQLKTNTCSWLRPVTVHICNKALTTRVRVHFYVITRFISLVARPAFHAQITFVSIF